MYLCRLLSGIDTWENLRVCEGAVRRPLEDGASDCGGDVGGGGIDRNLQCVD